MSIKITWLGHAAFHLKINTTSVLIDPFLKSNPLAPYPPEQAEADFILLTHAHADHLGDSIAISHRTNAIVVAVAEIAHWVEEQGVAHSHAMNVGGGFTFPFGHVKYVMAEHSSSFPDGSYAGLACGIVISAEKKRLYFAGDTALFGDMKLLADPKIDVAFLPIGDNYTMGPDDSITATKWISPDAVFPIHYNTWASIQQDAGSWARRINNETQAHAIVLDPGSSFSL
ncbi:MAG TPA: metal-dependent hydrolase [Aggregatilineales bacterium]|nr:metal-dependent hydrolase [Aggregatilineales bacterium]